MTPALALFYAGMVRRKNVLATLMHSMAAIPVLSLKWCLFGYSLAFGPTKFGLIGGLDFIGLRGLASDVHGTVPTLAFVAFQMMFAVITPALISGAFAERMKFTSYLVFVLLWSTFVYDPVAHWVWADGGWLFKMGALDFAGGTVVHLSAGVSALACAIVVGKRYGYPHRKPMPHNLTMTLTGAGLLWFGWFGFNAGSALSSGALAALAFVTTQLGAAGGAVSWVLVESLHRGKPTALGVASGLVAGLVAITPAAGFVAPWAAILIGLAAGGICYAAVLQKDRLGYDDSLDAFGIHGVGGLAGALLTGVFAQKSLNEAGNDGALFGNVHVLTTQLIGCGVTMVYAFALTFGILKLIDAVMGLRVSENDEREGLDVTLHGEEGYVLSGGSTAAEELMAPAEASAPSVSTAIASPRTT
ncbi:ammonium transporter [Pendulispora albinea]|uniref:Ammonium transporter n=2 Tax=Pendulispora albinea TaxID=2741071 RepID=A0ABZ2LPG4_9BACT